MIVFYFIMRRNTINVKCLNINLNYLRDTDDLFCNSLKLSSSSETLEVLISDNLKFSNHRKFWTNR